MRQFLGVFLALTLICENGTTRADEVERLAKATEQYAKCMDTALGNFATDAESQAAVRSLADAMLKNVRRIVATERSKPNPTTAFWLETLGEEALVGYLFKSFSEVTAAYRAERQSLREKNNFDWRVTNQQLWSRNGCDAIHSQVTR